jgi:hypothetical protein
LVESVGVKNVSRRIPQKNAYTVVYEKAGVELARYSLTAFSPRDAKNEADRRLVLGHPAIDPSDASVSARVET